LPVLLFRRPSFVISRCSVRITRKFYDQLGIVDAKGLQKETRYVSFFLSCENGTLLNLYKLRNFMLYIIIGDAFLDEAESLCMSLSFIAA
jgi:hypothetical protein